MLNILRKRQTNTLNYKLNVSDNIQNKVKNGNLKYRFNNNIQNKVKNGNVKNRFISEYKNIIYYPSSTREWFNSIYTYNKSYTKSLVAIDHILNSLFRNYFSMLNYKIKILFKRRHNNKSRYSANKIYISKPEIKHANSKLFIILYTYNKQKSLLEGYIRKYINLKTVEERLIKRKIKYITKSKNRLVYVLKKGFFYFRKWNIVFLKKSDNPLKYLISNIKKRYQKLRRISIYNRYLRKIFRLKQIFFNNAKLINFNLFKFSNLLLNLRELGTISLIQKIYNKNIEIKIVELRSIHLNNDVFSFAVALKLRNRHNKAVRVLRKAILQMVKIPDLHTLITFDDRKQVINKNNILSVIEQQVISGVRFEASGRLTRRLTALRAIFKYRYLGSLKNIRSSYNSKSSTILRGNTKSNSQYAIINSKTRNGAFGLKGWTSSH